MSEETLADLAYREIKSRILSGEIGPQSELSERLLAEATQISRTPLRIAIQRLEKEGVIARMTNGALMLREVTLQQLLEITETRRILEGAAAAQAARAAAQSGLSPALIALRGKMEHYLSSADSAFDRFWEDDDAFHLAIARAAGWEILPDILRALRETARRCTISRSHDDFATQAAEHLAVIEAIAAGNDTEARAAMERHFDSVRQRFLARMLRH